MSTLAHVFEAAGIATVALSATRGFTERMAPPRALHCEFPLGRPLGKPGDAEFQHDVLRTAFAMLDEPSGPVLVDYPTVVESDETPLTCQIPPRYDGGRHAAVEEASGIRKAYDRTVERRGVTSVGRSIDADAVPDALAVFAAIVDGTEWKDAGIPGGNTIAVCHDIRTYYEEAALELATVDAPAGRAIEAWYFEQTDAGKLILETRKAMKDQGAPFPFWFYMAPGHR